MINEDMNQVMRQTRQDVFRDLRVASPCYVTRVHSRQVDVQLTVMDTTDGVDVVPPEVKNLFVVGVRSGDMPDVGDLGIMLHLDRKNQVSAEVQRSGGPAHEIGYGVFLPLIQ